MRDKSEYLCFDIVLVNFDVYFGCTHYIGKIDGRLIQFSRGILGWSRQLVSYDSKKVNWTSQMLRSTLILYADIFSHKH